MSCRTSSAPGLALSPFGFDVNFPGLNATGLRLTTATFSSRCRSASSPPRSSGIVLERGIIRFLYRRPLESLLATWGVSLVLQQLFRLTFGANNVQVESHASSAATGR